MKIISFLWLLAQVALAQNNTPLFRPQIMKVIHKATRGYSTPARTTLVPELVPEGMHQLVRGDNSEFLRNILRRVPISATGPQLMLVNNGYDVFCPFVVTTDSSNELLLEYLGPLPVHMPMLIAAAQPAHRDVTSDQITRGCNNRFGNTHDLSIRVTQAGLVGHGRYPRYRATFEFTQQSTGAASLRETVTIQEGGFPAAPTAGRVGVSVHRSGAPQKSDDSDGAAD